MVFLIHSVFSRSSFLFSLWQFELFARTCTAMFVFSSGALFRFTFVHTAKLKKSIFLNDFFLSLTAFFVRDVISLSLSQAKVFCVIRV